jgi:cellulose biosynthesis protein BcsQ
MGKVIAVYSMKGGVGKSSLAVNLAFEAARTGKALLWDVDAQGPLPSCWGRSAAGRR